MTGSTSTQHHDRNWLTWGPSDSSTSRESARKLRGVSQGTAVRLRDATVGVVGVGAVGRRMLNSLVRLDVNRCFLVDPDAYGPHSHWTQSCTVDDVGRWKVEAAAGRAHAVNPHIRIAAVVACLQDLPWWVVHLADVIALAGDNLEVLVAAAMLALSFGIPLAQGAVDPDTRTAFARLYNLRMPNSACPACAFSSVDWLRLRSREGCEPGVMLPGQAESTRAASHVGQTAAGLLVEAILYLLDLTADKVFAEERVLSLGAHRSLRTELVRNPQCRLPHRSWRVHRLTTPPERTTLSDLCDAAGATWECDSVLSGELSWISFADCSACHRRRSVRRFGKTGLRIGRCRCGAALTATPQGVRQAIPPSDRMRCVDRPLSELGLPCGRAVLVETEDTTHCIFVGTPENVPFMDDDLLSVRGGTR